MSNRHISTDQMASRLRQAMLEGEVISAVERAWEKDDKLTCLEAASVLFMVAIRWLNREMADE